MRLTRVFVDAPLASDTSLSLRGSAANHLARVLRLREGAAVTLFNGRGGEYAAAITRIDGKTVEVALGAMADPPRESPLSLTLAQGVSRGERMDLVVQKATELGLTRLVPILTERSVVRLDATQAQRRQQHWRSIAIAACEQSGRNIVPQVDAPLTLAHYLAADTIPSLQLLLSPGADRRVADLPTTLRRVSVLVGPEGGLSDEEAAAAVRAGFTPVRLGPRVLRTETAAIAALAALQQHCGDL